MPRLYLGIDGGQSSTKALLCDETGKVLGQGTGGPCNHVKTAEGRAKFLGAVGDCLREASHQAGIETGSLHFASVCLGLSGGSEDKEAYARELIASDRYKLTHDAEIALTGGTAGEPGIIVIGGTGSIAFGKNRQLQTMRAGGWGYIFGDEGGAFDLTREALRAALRQEEGWGPATKLTEVLLEVSGERSVNALLHSIYGSFDRAHLATWARHIDDAAKQGDQVSLEILERAATELNQYISGVYRGLFKTKEVVSIVHVGGVFSSDILRTNLAQRIQLETGCKLVAPLFSPMAGAAIEALRADGNNSPLLMGD